MSDVDLLLKTMVIGFDLLMAGLCLTMIKYVKWYEKIACVFCAGAFIVLAGTLLARM
jgi:hypothetical protein